MGKMLTAATEGKSKHRSGLEILPPFFSLTNFLTPEKKPVPLFSLKSPISYKKKAVFAAIFP